MTPRPTVRQRPPVTLMTAVHTLGRNGSAISDIYCEVANNPSTPIVTCRYLERDRYPHYSEQLNILFTLQYLPKVSCYPIHNVCEII